MDLKSTLTLLSGMAWASLSYAGGDTCYAEIAVRNNITTISHDEVVAFTQQMVLADVAGAVIGKKSYLVDEAKRLKETGSSYNQELLYYIERSGNSVDKALARRALYSAIGKTAAGESTYNSDSYASFFKCALNDAASTQLSMFADALSRFIKDGNEKYNRARVGYFEIAVESCEVKSRVETGNQFAEPDSWAGSRFMIVDATFKNLDKEGRLPAEGELIINSNGEEYVYDHAEAILHSGYGIFLESLNPLVTMRTKIVYRIPNEIGGEVYWRPGRNVKGQKLWCNYVDSTKG